MHKLINIGTQANSQFREYIADSVDDIATLPDSDPFGSTVFIIETSETYMKSSSGGYVKIMLGNSGGGYSDGTFVISADATVDGTSLTFSNIDKTPEELASVVAKKKPIYLRMDVLFDEDEHIFVYTPLSQVMEDLYEFSAVVSVDSSGVDVVDIVFDNDDGEWSASGSFVTIATS